VVLQWRARVTRCRYFLVARVIIIMEIGVTSDEREPCWFAGRCELFGNEFTRRRLADYI